MAKFTTRLLSSLPPHEKRITVSTLFTFARIVLAPFIVAAMIMHYWGIAFWLFVIAAATDVLDGNIARFFNQKTFLGACLDPIADKLLLVPCFATLAFIKTPLFSIPQWFVLLVLFKELIILAGAFIIFYVRGHLEVTPTLLGKMTTVVQVWFIIWLFACYFFGWRPVKTYYAMLGLLLVLVVSTLVQYVYLGLAQWRGSST